ncbi:hypothetical protein CAPTEDRAFT_151823 [Capitella teleta]|uniref:GOLD domain-containing protein n=1 Tax=Capitella teleta TaxID=283909 RepID=R7VJ49_CAPTE|nr:hypothetical protein CAPTEDRAFT_151823 [Capitella teleta]|eukprot:ELU16346.1 hypothetical protein CAPTEDRAFT_151823 [Capitella teleta]
MMDTLPDPNMISSLLLTSGDLLDQGGQVDSEPELWVRAGKSYAVPIMVERSGLTLKWQFSTQPKGIHFSVAYSEHDFVPISACEVLIPTTACNSHKEEIEGELLAHKPGVYTLVFDNTTSRFTAKKLLYKLYTEDQEETRDELHVT